MSTRKVKDAKDLETGEKIYLKGHAKATYMSDGRNVEDAINSVSGSGDIDLSDYATKEELGNKVDKVNGKQLSTEDFTKAFKEKLESLNNYDDSDIESALSKLRSDFDTLVSGDTTTAIETFNEIIAFLEGVSDSENLDSIIAAIEQQIAGKQDKITDLETIRSGAAKGNTALQTSGGTLTGEIQFRINDLIYKDISAGIIAAFKVPRVQINELISKYIYLGSDSQGNSSDTSLVIRKYSSITDKSPSGTTDLVTIDISGNVTAIGGFTGNLTGTATQADNANRVETGFTKGVRLGNEGAINEGWVRIAKGIHGYQSQFIVSLKKSASNSNDENYTFAVNCKYAGAFINQLSGGFRGANNAIKKVRVDFVDSGTCYFDFYVSDTTRFNDYSWVVYGSANTLDATFNPEVTGTIIEFETANGIKSDVGFTGDLNGTATSAIQDGEGNDIADTYANKVSVINHGTNDTTYTLTPNTLHIWDSVASLDLAFGAVDNTIYNEFMFQFSSGSNPTTLILPDSIKWVSTPVIDANKIYQCSVVNNVGVIASVDNA